MRTQVVVCGLALVWGSHYKALPELAAPWKEVYYSPASLMEQYVAMRKDMRVALTLPVSWCLLASSGTATVFYGMLFQVNPLKPILNPKP